MKQALIILGSPNNEQEELGFIALDRLNCCLEVFNLNKNLILCTGGYGEHFNRINN